MGCASEGYDGEETTPTKQSSGSLRDDTPEKFTRVVDVPRSSSDGGGESQGKSGDMPAGWGSQGSSEQGRVDETEVSNTVSSGKALRKIKSETDGSPGIVAVSTRDETTAAGDTAVPPGKKVPFTLPFTTLLTGGRLDPVSR